MLSTLILPQPLRVQLAAEARAAFPYECCGLVEGVREGDKMRALALRPTANFSEEPDGFEIDPTAHLRLMRELRGSGREIVGCYHSHPRGLPVPSRRDRERGGTEGFVWLIAALGEEAGVAELSAFADVNFRPLALSD
ncbi:MAG: M67 family metallopeptidase [Rhizomicrobium sp.]